jgi:hypothetical protein
VQIRRMLVIIWCSLQSKNVKVNIYRSIILPVVLYGYGTWSLILKKESRLRVFENTVLRRIIWASEGRDNMGMEKTT